MASNIRDERTHGLKHNPDVSQVLELMAVVGMPGWQRVLDVMERVCITQETKLINADSADEARVLAEHRMSKAYWQVFVSMQNEIERLIREYAEANQPEAEDDRTENERVLGFNEEGEQEEE